MFDVAYHWRTSIWVVFCSVAMYCAAPVTTRFDGTWFNFIMDTINLVSIFAVVLVLLSTARHKLAICIECIHSVPSNAAVVAHRKDKNLRNWHAIIETKMSIIIGIAITYLVIVYVKYIPVFDTALWHWVFTIPTVVYWGVMGMHFYNTGIHDKVNSFCPYCKGGNDDDHSPNWVPDPSGSKIA